MRYDSLAAIIDAYEAGDVSRDDLIRLLVAFRYKEPSYKRIEREHPPRTDGEMWIAIDARIYDEDDTWGEVTRATTLGRIPRDLYYDVQRRRWKRGKRRSAARRRTISG